MNAPLAVAQGTLTLLSEAALLLAFAVFVAVVARLFARRHAEEFARASRLPLADDAGAGRPEDISHDRA